MNKTHAPGQTFPTPNPPPNYNLEPQSIKYVNIAIDDQESQAVKKAKNNIEISKNTKAARLIPFLKNAHKISGQKYVN